MPDVWYATCTEAVNAHIKIVRISVYCILSNCRILGIKVNAVTCYLAVLVGIIVPVEITIETVVIIVVRVSNAVV